MYHRGKVEGSLYVMLEPKMGFWMVAHFVLLETANQRIIIKR